MKKQRCAVQAETVEGDTRLLIFAYHRKNEQIPDKIVLRCQVIEGKLKAGDVIKTETRGLSLRAKIISLEENCVPISEAVPNMKIGILVEGADIEKSIERISEQAVKFYNPHAIMA